MNQLKTELKLTVVVIQKLERCENWIFCDADSEKVLKNLKVNLIEKCASERKKCCAFHAKEGECALAEAVAAAGW